MADGASVKRRFFVPEVIQTSAMDCGPAALKALFGGFDVYLSYGRLREACQTDVDGTSIDTLEEIAAQLGMAVAQSMLPTDLIFLKSTAALPAIAVVRRVDGGTHFVVIWRVHGPWVQVMDPAGGRLWMQRQRFLDSLYIHEQPVPRSAWDEWSTSEVFTAALVERLQALGVAVSLWPDRAHLDAALRLAGCLRHAGQLKNGAEAQRLLDVCSENRGQIPDRFWTIRTIPDDNENVLLCGAVLLTATGPLTETSAEPLPESLAAVRSEAPPRVWEPVWQAVRERGWLLPGAIAAALLVAAFGTVIEALLFRSLFDLGRHFQLSAERLGAMAALLLFLLCLLALEWPAAAGQYRIGRYLELRLRTRLMAKIPRLSDRYFQSRLISDMASRVHQLHQLRQLPEIAGQLLRLTASLLVTASAVAWLYPGSVVLVLLAVGVACGVPILFLPAMVERDLRFREISAALSRFYLDSLLGSRAIQAHGAEGTLRAAQARQLEQWAHAGLRQQSLFARADAVQMGLTLALVVGLIVEQAVAVTNPAGLLLLIYWAISIPLIGRQLATVAWSLPALRNTLLRFLEPLGSPEAAINAATAATAASAAAGVGGARIDIDAVSVVVAGRRVLDEVTLQVDAGEHIGIVGLSGAGKSSLAGLLLGWYQPAQGSVHVDGVPLDAAKLAQLRRETAWIDPQVQLFRATLFDNLRYGNGPDAAGRIGAAIDLSGLDAVLERLPEGLQSPLGDGGGMLSGGEGQSVRMARALARSNVRLVILDEPARGLDRERRRQLLHSARTQFATATMLCITHDVSDTLEFDRVLVIEQGRIVEQGMPTALREAPGSRYRQLLDAEDSVGRELWSHPKWRRLRLRGGRLDESPEMAG
jgi:ATP-binding cassette subfamily B protein